MTGLTYTIRVDDAAVRAALASMIDGLEDLTPVMDAVGAVVEESTRDRLARTNIAPDGTPWTPSLRARERGGPTLYDSGRLAASITRAASRDQVEVGANAIYAAVHQGGATIRAKTKKALRFKVGGRFVTKKQVTIPARPFIGVSEADGEEIVAVIEDALAARLGGGGGAAP